MTGFHIDERYLDHRTPAGHPERGERITTLLELADELDGGTRVLRTGRNATDAELTRVHLQEYVDAIAATAGKRVALDADTQTSEESYQVALAAAGGTLDAVDRIQGGELANAFVAVRPPGHHAERDRAMGFCLFNNIAVAAAHLRQHHGLERVLVVDFDVHHGNGTQRSFYDDPHVMFVSLHQYPYYPGTGGIEEIGVRDGEGATINVPLPPGCGDAEYAAVFDTVVRPAAESFDPDFVLVSAGFDAHANDPLGAMGVTELGFGYMTEAIVDIATVSCGGKVAMVLEGGYNANALRASVRSVIEGLQGRKVAGQIVASASNIQPIVDHVLKLHARHWK